MINYKLTSELVPKTSWYDNVRSKVSADEWNVIRKISYEKANHKCEICGDTGKNQGFKHNVECHEIWEYNDENHTQKLTGLISLCPYCHKVKHPGLAKIKGESDIVIKQLMKVNDITKKEAEDYLKNVFNVWQIRSKSNWTVDITYLNNLFIDNNEKPWWEKYNY
jgi:5-methylcytosine-specific restriction endonuclease McrA